MFFENCAEGIPLSIRKEKRPKTLSGPLEHLEADLRAHRVNYGNNAILTWCLCNATTETDRNGNRLLSKALSRQRIDGAAASLDAYVGLDKYQLEFMQLT